MDTNISPTQLPLDQLRQIRIQKINKIRELGIDPYLASGNRSHDISEIVDNFEKLEGSNVSVCGRILSWREHGALAFADVSDESGHIQLYLKADQGMLFNAEKGTLDFEKLNLLDIGDFVEVTGEVTKTKRGEISILVHELKLLTKSVRPLPSMHFGIKDEEERYRQRYVDFILNPELRELFYKKAKFWNSFRSFLLEKGFLEVETPVLENTAGGADARPFVTHHNSLDIDVFLRISMGELWQKRLMVVGFEKTFEIGRQFRNEGQSREHLQDYTQMEFYWAYANYENGMKLVEEMYKYVANQTFGTMKFTIGEHEVDLGKEWEKIDFTEAIKKDLGVDILHDSLDILKNKASELKLEFSENDERGRIADILWKQVRKNISGPAFLVGHPVEVSPLAKRDPKQPQKVERFQVLIAGSEQGNGYSELNDPIDQAERFEEQQRLRDSGDDEAQMYDHDFVRALEYGMPPVCGFGVSERTFSTLANKPIKECVMFPLLKPETNE